MFDCCPPYSPCHSVAAFPGTLFLLQHQAPSPCPHAPRSSPIASSSPRRASPHALMQPSSPPLPAPLSPASYPFPALIAGSTYEAALRSQHTTLNPRTAWAKAPPTSGSGSWANRRAVGPTSGDGSGSGQGEGGSGDEGPEGQGLEGLLSSAGGLLGTSTTRLAPGSIETSRLKVCGLRFINLLFFCYLCLLVIDFGKVEPPHFKLKSLGRLWLAMGQLTGQH